ncbi:hypothetical protein [Cypionkella sp.]|uniref:hypothetical protein n=1 Tax=Cypionkella sp. TaxID=2811411 RepID=UPI002724A575|nr:hypothetical protein [Cypionkella sp.]MDO8986076.1 hypothetical protein [Cypionkella sp.]MDP2047598.1 hypothetical protein [Cypionkella sp.]
MSWIDPAGPEWRELLAGSSARMAEQDAAEERAFSQAQDARAAAGWDCPALGVDPSAGGFQGVTGYATMLARGD